MFRHTRRLAAAPIALTFLLVGFGILRAAQPRVPIPTDEDYRMQGEYTGPVLVAEGAIDIGVQVIAEGDGRFTAVGFQGGLPGVDWDHTARQSTKGTLKDGAVEFTAGNSTARIEGGVMTISLGGVKIAELPKLNRESHTLGNPPPLGAIVLFDGVNADEFAGGKMDEDNLLLPGCTSKQKFGSGKLHLEFRVPYLPKAQGQDRGNSGVYLEGRYEIQILDSFGLGETDTGCGAIYGLRAPDLNRSYPPMAWQTYDIDFNAVEYKDGLEVAPATVKVRHNGNLIHRLARLAHPTAGATLAAGPDPGPIHLQDHGNPVRFRNIWFLP